MTRKEEQIFEFIEDLVENTDDVEFAKNSGSALLYLRNSEKLDINSDVFTDTRMFLSDIEDLYERENNLECEDEEENE